MAVPSVVAHAGGWDEAAILLGPVIVFLVLRYMGRNAPEAAPPDEGSEEPPEAPPDARR